MLQIVLITFAVMVTSRWWAPYPTARVKLPKPPMTRFEQWRFWLTIFFSVEGFLVWLGMTLQTFWPFAIVMCIAVMSLLAMIAHDVSTSSKGSPASADDELGL
jgi:hypothetical protein